MADPLARHKGRGGRLCAGLVEWGDLLRHARPLHLRGSCGRGNVHRLDIAASGLRRLLALSTDRLTRGAACKGRASIEAARDLAIEGNGAERIALFVEEHRLIGSDGLLVSERVSRCIRRTLHALDEGCGADGPEKMRKAQIAVGRRDSVLLELLRIVVREGLIRPSCPRIQAMSITCPR